MANNSYALNNGATGALSFRISRFTDGTNFKTLKKYNHFTVILFVKGSGELVVDACRYSFDNGSLMSFSLYQPIQISCSGACEGFSVEFHPDFFCLHKHRNEVSCNGVLFNNLYESPLIRLTGANIRGLTSVFNGALTEMRRAAIDAYP